MKKVEKDKTAILSEDELAKVSGGKCPYCLSKLTLITQQKQQK